MDEKLYIVRGPIGAGKSSVTQELYRRMPNHASLVEVDGIKRMLDPTESSQWRRDLSNETAAFMIDQVLRLPRSAIVETHTKYPEEVERFFNIASRIGVPCVSVLLTAPLEVCEARAAARIVPGISYSIDLAMVRDYYCNLEPQTNDLAFDTSVMRPPEIVDDIISWL